MNSIKSLLGWYIDAGVDEAMECLPVDRRNLAGPQTGQPAAGDGGDGTVAGMAFTRPSVFPLSRTDDAARSSPHGSASAGAWAAAPAPEAVADVVQSAYRAAQEAETIDNLRRALEAFEGCALRRTATNLVFADGDPAAKIIFIGEAPGADEDRQGIPFVGASGRLLDRMLASIGLARADVLISNTVFWRPPGNRTPTTAEAAACRPFVERLIEIVAPQVLVALGGAAAKSLLGRAESVGRLRGLWLPFSTPRLSRPVQATVTFHPAYLLRTPAEKREAWRDLLNIKKKLIQA